MIPQLRQYLPEFLFICNFTARKISVYGSISISELLGQGASEQYAGGNGGGHSVRRADTGTDGGVSAAAVGCAEEREYAVCRAMHLRGRQGAEACGKVDGKEYGGL